MERIQELNNEMKKKINFEKKTIDMITGFNLSIG
jgi:hypothetical protein